MLALFAAFYCSLIVSINAKQCITSYPNHTIEYILSHLNDPSIIYLGDKTSTRDCIDSCIDLNYLCDKSINNVFSYSDDAANSYIFDNISCSAQSTHSGDMMSYGSFALLTSSILSKDYIIEIQLTITSGEQGGVVFKAQESPNWNYWVYINPRKNTMPTGPYETNWDSSWWHDTDTFSTNYNTKYNLSIHIINNTFQRYLNQQAIGNIYVFDESLWSESYAGLFIWRGTVKYHSFKLKFTNINDNEDKYNCRAYLYDKQQAHCYGYYGNDYISIENSISFDEEKQYQSGIVYETETCSPTQYPTTSPSATTTETTTPNPTTTNPTTFNPTTSNPTTSNPTTSNPTTSNPTTSNPTTSNPTTSNPTTSNPTTSNPTTSNPTTSNPTTSNPTTSNPTTSNPTTSNPTTSNAATSHSTTANPTTPHPTKLSSVNPTSTSSMNPTKTPSNIPTSSPINHAHATISPSQHPSNTPTNNANRKPTAPTNPLTAHHDKDTTATPNSENAVKTTIDDDRRNVNEPDKTESDGLPFADWMYIVFGCVAVFCCLTVSVITIKCRNKKKKNVSKHFGAKVKKERKGDFTIPYNIKMQSVSQVSPALSPVNTNDANCTLDDFTLFNDGKSHFEQDLVNNIAVSDVMMDTIINHMSTPNGDSVFNGNNEPEIEMIQVDDMENYNAEDDDGQIVGDIENMMITPMGNNNDNDEDDEIVANLDGTMATPGNNDINTDIVIEGEGTTDSDNIKEFETPSGDDVYNYQNNVEITLGNHSIAPDEFVINDDDDDIINNNNFQTLE